MSVKSKFLRAAPIAGLAVAGGFAYTPAKAEAEVVIFIPGTYYLSDEFRAPPVDTLVVSISGGVAEFSLSGQDTATFAVQNNSAPTGYIFPDNPFYSVASIVSASWSASDYPYLTFWSRRSDGGVSVGTEPDTSGTNLFDTFQSTHGRGQVFTLSVSIPEPSTWAMIVLGFAGLGFLGYSQNRNGQAATALAVGGRKTAFSGVP
jgi:hypothetical protein